MLKLFEHKNINAFGLDISDTSIKVLRLKPLGYANLALPEKVISSHMIVNPDRLAENIKAAMKEGKIDAKYAVCSIPEVKSFVRTVTLPSMPDEEIDSAVRLELEQDIPIPIDAVYLDWQIARKMPDKLDILVTAAPKDYIDLLIESLHTADLWPIAMELESQATARAVIGLEEGQKTVLLADMSTEQTSFIIVDRGLIQYTSSIPIAGNAFTENIAKVLNIPKTEAEKIKKLAGLTEETKQANIRSAILPILDKIVDEIKNVVKFFEEHDATRRSISSLILCGGTAQMAGLSEYISARLNLGSQHPAIRVALANPWVNISTEIKMQQSLGFATVIGLALRGINHGK